MTTMTEAEMTARIAQLEADAARKRQEVQLAPKHLFAATIAAFAAAAVAAGALITAGVGLANLFHWIAH